jgi:hypothetical protein
MRKRASDILPARLLRRSSWSIFALSRFRWCRWYFRQVASA